MTETFRLGRYMSGLGYLVTNFATNPEGGDLVAEFNVVSQIGDKNTFVQIERHYHPEAYYNRAFGMRPELEDEIWRFRSSDDSWQHLAGIEGVALVRKGTVINVSISTIS
jgi:hypothetical protein